jgi:hypothetical protein
MDPEHLEDEEEGDQDLSKFEDNDDLNDQDTEKRLPVLPPLVVRDEEFIPSEHSVTSKPKPARLMVSDPMVSHSAKARSAKRFQRNMQQQPPNPTPLLQEQEYRRGQHSIVPEELLNLKGPLPPRPVHRQKDPQLPRPAPPVPQSRCSYMISLFVYYLRLFMFAMVVVGIYHVTVVSRPDLASFFSMKEKGEDVFAPLKMIDYMPAVKCYPVSKEEFLFKKTDGGWKHVIDSMFHYMVTEDLDSISSFHVGDASCFMMLRQEDKSILQMYNPNFKGYHDTVFVRVNEVSMACPQITRVVERANTIIMSYNEAESGDLVIEKFNYTQAWTAQATGFYLKGKTICETGKSNTDNGRVTLKEEIEGHK